MAISGARLQSRLAALARELGAMGASVSERPDGLVIEGPTRLRGARVRSGGDHRIAMALAVAGLVAEGETRISRIYHLDRGYEALDQKLVQLGASVRRVKE